MYSIQQDLCLHVRFYKHKLNKDKHIGQQQSV